MTPKGEIKPIKDAVSGLDDLLKAAQQWASIHIAEDGNKPLAVFVPQIRSIREELKRATE